jgi:MYXO-CTERM domain-containing protein
MSVSSSIARRLVGMSMLSLVLAVAAPARAGVIGSFDPAFGPSIPNLGFRGTIMLDVTAGCYALGGGFHFTGGACSVTATSAQVNFYNATSGSGTLSTVNLTAATFGTSYVFGVYIDPVTGAFAGLDTNDSSLFGVSVTDPNPLAPIAYTGSMLLYFTSGMVPPIGIASFDALSSSSAVTAVTAGFGGAFLVNCGPFGGSCSRSTSPNSNRASLTFSAVPEPDALALGLLGAVGLAVMRRRTKRESARRFLNA